MYGLVILRRAAIVLITMLVASIVIYGALYLAPGGPIAFLSSGRPLSPSALAALRHHYHLDDPFLQRYALWLWGVLHGDLGTSLVFRQGVVGLLGPRLVTTAYLLVYSGILILIVGNALGILAALREGVVSTAITTTTAIGIAVPAFITAVVLISVFAVNLGWFPVTGSGSGFFDRLHHLTLPAIALALPAIAYVARLTRAAVAEELGREHVQAAIGRGIPRRKVIYRHVVRNAMIPIVTVSGITLASLVAGTAVVETAFQVDGLGSFLISSVTNRDFPVVQAIALILVTGFILVNVIVDILYGVLDPRVREAV
ncbi:MAG TPA: ABC transporter permease [Solirubrobacterales bacterium]|nr:ABC transporter permease [Solirubrobacterales bacterium]